MKKLLLWYKDFNQKHKRFCEVARFVIVGGIATAIDMLVMGIILYSFDPTLYPKFYNVWIGKVGNPRVIAAVLGTGSGFIVSLIANYILSILFVYEEKGNSKSVKGALLFFIFSAIGLFLNMGGMWLGYDIIGINEWITKIIMTLIVLFYNYAMRKLFIFKKAKHKDTNADNVTIDNK